MIMKCIVKIQILQITNIENQDEPIDESVENILFNSCSCLCEL